VWEASSVLNIGSRTTDPAHHRLTQDSGLRTHDSGLRTQDSGLRTPELAKLRKFRCSNSIRH
jgi:hypothetical protein